MDCSDVYFNIELTDEDVFQDYVDEAVKDLDFSARTQLMMINLFKEY